jgi:O-antigen/teichoic acid export membrane protein
MYQLLATVVAFLTAALFAVVFLSVVALFAEGMSPLPSLLILAFPLLFVALLFLAVAYYPGNERALTIAVAVGAGGIGYLIWQAIPAPFDHLDWIVKLATLAAGLAALPIHWFWFRWAHRRRAGARLAAARDTNASSMSSSVKRPRENRGRGGEP